MQANGAGKEKRCSICVSASAFPHQRWVGDANREPAALKPFTDVIGH
jgi:hypothetical protein